MDSITITRALTELKLLDKRIRDKINATTFCDLYQKRQKFTLQTKNVPADYETKTMAQYESIKDLMKRRKDIKAAIMLSNNVVNVKLCGEEMTVAEAICMKTSIEYDKSLLGKMRGNLTQAKNAIEQANEEIAQKTEKMLENNLGADKKASKEDYDAIAKPFIEHNELKLLDPLKLETKIDELNDKIDAFESEVDFVLSESNAKTEIEV